MSLPDQEPALPVRLWSRWLITRRPPAGATALCAMAMVAGFCLPAHLPGSTGYLLVCCLLFALLTLPDWMGKLSGRLAMVMLLLVGGLAWRDPHPFPIGEGLTRYRTVVALMFGIALLQRLIGGWGLQKLILQQGNRLPQRWRAMIFGSIASLLALPLSMATIPLFATVLGPVASPRLAAAKIPMRAVCLTMLIVPSTVASAAVSASLPGLNGLHVALLGLPLFLAGQCSLLGTSLSLTAQDEVPVDITGLPGKALCFWGSFLAALFAGLSVPSSIAVAGLLLYLVDMRTRRRSLRSALDEIGLALQNGSAEVVLLMVCGLLAQSLLHTALPAGIHHALGLLWQNPVMASGLLVFILPMVAALGIHPLILFNLLFPLVDNTILGALPLQYLAWSTMFLAAQLLSPVSISALLAASSLSTSPNRTSFGLHLRFVLGFGALIFCYLNGLRGLQLG